MYKNASQISDEVLTKVAKTIWFREPTTDLHMPLKAPEDYVESSGLPLKAGLVGAGLGGLGLGSLSLFGKKRAIGQRIVEGLLGLGGGAALGGAGMAGMGAMAEFPDTRARMLWAEKVKERLKELPTEEVFRRAKEEDPYDVSDIPYK